MLAEKTDQKEFVPLTEAGRLFPVAPSASSLRRWHTDGVRGVRLRTLAVGGRRFTCAAWVEEFLSATNEADASEKLGA